MFSSACRRRANKTTVFHEFALDAVKAGELSTIFAVDGANLGEGVRLAMRLDLPVRKRCEGYPRVLFDEVCLTKCV